MSSADRLRVAVLSDLHANARALRAAAALIEARGADAIVVLGDLLTYGVDVAETLDLVHELQARRGAILLAGNHDEFYFELFRARRDDTGRLPEWIQESIGHARAELGRTEPPPLEWRESYAVDGVLFAHANSFAFGDWTYLNDDVTIRRAADALRERGFGAGVFGHTHRAGHWLCTGEACLRSEQSAVPRHTHTVSVLNPGSTGQPRNTPPESTMLFLELGPDRIEIAFERLGYDVGAHLAALAAAGLSRATVERLVSFFGAGGASG